MSNYYNKKHLIPDALFAVRFKTRNYFFLLEMDRGTIASKLMMKRYQDYYDWWKKKGHENDFGVSSIRILTVTTSQRRMENLIKACYQVRESGAGSALFWFTITKHVDIFKPHLLLSRVWRKALPDNSNLYSLSD